MVRKVTPLKRDYDTPGREHWVRKKALPGEDQRRDNHLGHLNQLKRPDKDRQKSSRACLCCRRKFMSEGIHNRLCADCRAKDGGFDV